MPHHAPDFRLLTADRVIDGSGGPAIDGGGVLIEDERIARVGARDDLRAPDGAQVETQHYPGASLLPGFVDAHTHVVAPGDGTPGEGVAATEDEILLLNAVRGPGRNDGRTS